MKGWKESEEIEFDYYDAPNLRSLLTRASEDIARTRLRQRLANFRQGLKAEIHPAWQRPVERVNCRHVERESVTPDHG